MSRRSPRVVNHRSGSVTMNELRERIDVLEAEAKAREADIKAARTKVYGLSVLVGTAYQLLLPGNRKLARLLREDGERLGVAEGLFEGSNTEGAKA